MRKDERLLMCPLLFITLSDEYRLAFSAPLSSPMAIFLSEETLHLSTHKARGVHLYPVPLDTLHPQVYLSGQANPSSLIY